MAKRCLLLLSASLLLINTATAQPQTQEGVLVYRVGRGYLYVFPAKTGPKNPAGVINIGETITVMYSLKLIGNAKTRFIGMDASRTKGISPRLKVMKVHSTFGFFIKDTNQTTLQITIDPSFMRKLERQNAEQMRGKIATQGNLNVTFSEKGRTIVIEDVRLE